MLFVKAFLIGGANCVIAQLLMDLTSYKITPTHILVGLVTVGAIVSGLGFYQPLIDFSGAGATVPLSGFGHLLAQGAINSTKKGWLIRCF